MSDVAIATSVAELRQGHLLLMGCCILYLAWWTIFFRPSDARPDGAIRAIGVACIVAAAACGFAGVWRIGLGTGTLRGAIDGWIINGCGIACYVLLLWVTSHFFDRPVTTELILIVGWATLEANVMNNLVGSGVVSGVAVVVLAALIAVLFVASMVCYVLYYKLGAWPSFVDGMVPLISVGIMSAVMALVVR